MKYTFEAPVVLVSHKTGEVITDGGKLTSSRINMFIEDDALSQLADHLYSDIGLDEIVTSIVPRTKYNGADIISVTVCETTKELTKDEVNTLADYIAGQFSDGWGESFEQQEIPVGRGYIYANFWSSNDDWKIKLV